MISGSLILRPSSGSDLDGTLYWSRPASAGGAAFSAGFSLNTAVVGSRYVQPAAGQPVVSVPATANNAVLVLGDGGIAAPVDQPATLNTDNSVVISTPELEQLSLRLNPANGLFTGKFVHPLTGAATKIRGVILQKQQAGFGFFLTPDGGGYATFAPAGRVASLSAL